MISLSIYLMILLSLGDAKKKKKKKKPKKKKPEQSDPPRVGLSKFFPNGQYPVGEICEYKNEYAGICLLRVCVLQLCL